MDLQIPERDETASLRRRVAELEARRRRIGGRRARARWSGALPRALETTFAGIAITDAEENLLFANPALGEIVEHEVDERVGANLSQFVESQDHECFQELTEQCSQGLRNSYGTHVYALAMKCRFIATPWLKIYFHSFVLYFYKLIDNMNLWYFFAINGTCQGGCS